MWHKLDYSFLQPRLYAVFLLAVSQSKYDASFAVNSKLFAMCFMDDMTEFLYEARLAGLSFSLDITSKGLQVRKVCAKGRIFVPVLYYHNHSPYIGSHISSAIPYR